MKRFVAFVIIVLFLTGCTRQAYVSYTAESLPLDTPNAAVYEIKPDNVNIVSELSEPDFLKLDNSADLSEHYPEYVMIHFSSAVMTSPDKPYSMEAVRKIFEDNEVGTHYIIDREGKILCYVPEQYDAWHAGRGSFANDEKYTNKMNDYAIGIELVGIGTQTEMSTYMSGYEYGKFASLAGFTDKQYESLKLLTEDICKRYDIPYDREHIIGHNEYSKTKSDPGRLFDWNKIIKTEKEAVKITLENIEDEK